jgi:hypothetical protein
VAAVTISTVGRAAGPGRKHNNLGPIAGFWFVRHVKHAIAEVKQPTAIVHPREDDRAS